MYNYRIQFVFALLILGILSADVHGNENAKFEKDLITSFNGGRWPFDTKYEMEIPGIMYEGNDFLELRRAVLTDTPAYKAKLFKLDIPNNRMEMEIILNPTNMHVIGDFINNTLTDVLEFDIINRRKLILSGSVFFIPEGNYFKPSIYNIDYIDQGGDILNAVGDSIRGYVDNETIIILNEKLSSPIQLMINPIYGQLEENLHFVLLYELHQLPINALFSSKDELQAYQTKALDGTVRANKIIEHICKKAIDIGVFENEFKDNSVLMLPQIVDSLLMHNAINISNGTTKFGTIKANEDFIFYDDELIIGYISLNETIMTYEFNTKYNNATGVMKVIGKDIKLLLEMTIKKSSCYGEARLKVTKIGNLEIQIIPENLSNWSRNELRTPLVGHFRRNMMSFALDYLGRGIVTAYKATCEI